MKCCLSVASSMNENTLKDGASYYRGIIAKVKTTLYRENADLSKGHWNLKRKMWVTMHFPKIINQP